jgi:dTDP-4-dehydrorhamnose reductase
MRALLLGAGGQLGQEIIARAGASDIEVMARARGQTDITSSAMVEGALGETRADIVVNAAAYTNVDKAETEQDQAFAVNATGPAVIAAACAKAAIPLIHVSTDYVFDGKKATPYIESDTAAPLGVYGASKLAGESAVRERHKKHVILRTSWLYGKYGTNFLKRILRLADERDELRVVADQRGSPTSTVDLAEVILALAPRLVDSGNSAWGTYHFSGEGETTWCQFADEIISRREKWVGARPKLTPITSAEHRTAAPRPLYSVLDNRLFRTTFRLASRRPWQQSVAESVDALLAPRAQR